MENTDLVYLDSDEQEMFSCERFLPDSNYHLEQFLETSRKFFYDVDTDKNPW